MKDSNLITHCLCVMAASILTLGGSGVARAADAKPPNIIVILADDVGLWNVSAYHRGMMGGRTPNIDRIASEGALFTDYYAQQSCTAGRAAFIPARPVPHRAAEGRPARGQAGLAGHGPDHRRVS